MSDPDSGKSPSYMEQTLEIIEAVARGELEEDPELLTREDAIEIVRDLPRMRRDRLRRLIGTRVRRAYGVPDGAGRTLDPGEIAEARAWLVAQGLARASQFDALSPDEMIERHYALIDAFTGYPNEEH